MKLSLRSLYSRLTEKLKTLPRGWRLGLSIGVSTLLVALLAVLVLFRLSSTAPAVPPAEEAAPLRTLETPEPTPASTPEPTPTPEPLVVLQLRASSSDLDMLVTVVDEQGEAVTGVAFPLVCTYPDGSVRDEVTDTDGQFYRSGLDEGSYSVALAPIEGYSLPEPVSFKVSGKLAYEPLSNVREQAEVKTVTELPVAEVKQTQAEAPAPAPQVESISTDALAAQAAAQSGEEVFVIIEEPSEPAPSSTPEPTPSPEPICIYPDPYYEYSYSVGPNGRLLYADGSESDVLPVDENGQLSYGMRPIVTIMRIDADGGMIEVDAVPEEPEEGVEYVEEESSEVVSLLNADGSPVGGYQITATLVTPDPIIVYPDPEPSSTPTPTPTPGTQTGTVAGTPVGWRTEADGTCFYDIGGHRLTGLKEIDGKLYYFNNQGVKASSLGIDVSYFDGAIDWNQVKAHGIDFAIIRVAGRTWGSGVLFEDGYSYKMMEKGGRYLQEARAAGLKIGAYVWSSAINTNEAVEEASLALQILDGMPLDMPLYIDMEYSGNYPRGRADRLSAQQRTEIVQAFCTTVSNGGYRPGVYAGQNYWKEAISYSACANAGYNIWMASYTNNLREPTAFPWSFHIWQCSSTARIRGVGVDCDLNVIF